MTRKNRSVSFESVRLTAGWTDGIDHVGSFERLCEAELSAMPSRLGPPDQGGAVHVGDCDMPSMDGGNGGFDGRTWISTTIGVFHGEPRGFQDINSA